MAKLQEKYESKEAALEAFEALLVESDDEDGGVVLHDDVIKQFKTVNDTTKSLSAARKAEREAKGKLKSFENALDGREIEIDSLEDILDEWESLKTLKESGKLEGEDLEKRAKELASAQLETERKKFEREKAKLEKDLAEEREGRTKVSGKLSELTLSQQLSSIAEKKGVKSHSMKFIKRLGADEFEVNEDGEIVDKTDAGRSVEDWLDEIISESPTVTLDPKSAGANITNGGGAAGLKQFTRKQVDDWARNNPAKAAEAMKSVKSGEAKLVDG